MFSPLNFNPAVSGSEDAVVSTINARSQWVDIPGAPQTQSLTSHFPLYRLSGGAGIRVNNDKTGQQKTTAVSAAYAWQKHFKKTTLSIGAYGGIVYRSLDGSKLIAPGGSYENVIDHNDDNIPIALENDLIPDAGAGIYFYGEKLKLGISASHLLNNHFSFQTPEGISSIQYSPNGFVFLGYQFLLGTNFKLLPNVLYKTDLTESMIDASSILSYKNNIFLGGSFRSYLNQQTDAVAIIGGWNINDKFTISYSYDITLSELNTVSSGSHEIVLNYKIKLDKPRVGKEINNFRYLYY
jgi:type IX secretion system PorP/SprF family membrane protein